MHGFGRYILAGSIGVLVGCLAVSLLVPDTTLALPQNGASSADGIFAVQARLASDTYGLYLIDVRNQTILLYTYGGPRGRGLSLLSARSFRHDRQLTDFNTAKPSPEQVRQLLEAGDLKSALPPQSPPDSEGRTKMEESAPPSGSESE